jgi:MFS family permease
MPIFLKSIGFSVLWIGILEGVAEATAGLTKGYFGNLSDHLRKRLPFVQSGYLLSTISKPLMAVSIVPAWIFFCRLTDRVGKGLRTAPRDALLSSEAQPHNKGRIFGFHRSMDTIGAVAGPSMALVYLYYYPENYRELFLLAFIPGIIAVGLTLTLKEKTSGSLPERRPGFFTFIRYWKKSPVKYRQVCAGLLFFSIINSSDLFLMLRAKEAGLTDTSVIGVYIFYNLVYAAFAYPAGIIADRIGLIKMIVAGIFLFACVYGGMTFNGSLPWYVFLFFVYGIYAACTESVGKALLANTVDPGEVGTALGSFNAFQSIAALLASSLAGFVWFSSGPDVMFGVTAGIAFCVMIYFALMVSRKSH